MGNEQKITTQQRMLNFSALTRQHVHMLPKQTVNTEFTTIQFTYPKARLLAQTFIKVDVEYKLKHASKTTMSLDGYNAMKICRKITQDLNNGFMPAVMSGAELGLYNTITTHPDKYLDINHGMGAIEEQKASTSGATNKYSFTLEIKNTLNDSMLQGLILLQNNATQVTLNVDIGSVSDILTEAGFTGEIVSVSVTPCIVTYSVPAVAEAFPDISCLKLMQSKTTSFTSGGDNIVYLDTGTIYRKLAFYVTDENGNPVTEDEINGNIELSFNTADIPYSVSAPMLRALNVDRMGRKLPAGLYVFDFSSQSPLVGYGSSRDYIDTEKLTSFTLKLNTNGAVKVTTITEQLSRLV